MRSWPWLVIAACAASAPIWAAQTLGMVAPSSAVSAPSVKATRVQQRLAQHQREVSRLQQAVKQQESHSKQANEQLRQRDAEILKLQKQLQTLPNAAPKTGR